MDDRIEVEFTTLWDGDVEITTTAMLDATTGAVTDIGQAEEEADEVEILERTYVTLPNGGEVDVEDNGADGYWVDPAKVREALAEGHKP